MCDLPVSFPVNLLPGHGSNKSTGKGNWQNAPLCNAGPSLAINCTVTRQSPLLNIHCLYLPRCNEFVLTCEVHRHTLNNPDQNCCDILFDTEPIFTGKGTCYRTNKTIYEYYPYSFSSIKIWTNLLQDQTPGTIRIIVKSNSNSN